MEKETTDVMQDKQIDIPDLSALQLELDNEKSKTKFKVILRNTIFTLITVAAVAILVATLWMPVLQIYGSSMEPTLNEGQIVLSFKNAKLDHGEIIAFYYQNKVLVKRVIATQGQWVNIDENGLVYVDNQLIDEPYIQDRAKGNCDIEFPYQVPEGEVFVLGDHRSVSLDSRSSTIGCVGKDQLVGKISFKVWPFGQFGFVK